MHRVQSRSMADETHNTLGYITHVFTLNIISATATTGLWHAWSIVPFNLFDEHRFISQTDLKYHMTKSLFILFHVCSSGWWAGVFCQTLCICNWWPRRYWNVSACETMEIEKKTKNLTVSWKTGSKDENANIPQDCEMAEIQDLIWQTIYFS